MVEWSMPRETVHFAREQQGLIPPHMEMLKRSKDQAVRLGV